jgi:GxxExxY protein
VKILYEGEYAGEFIPDLIINNLVIVEIKATKNLTKEFEKKLINYLKSTEFEVGLLINFNYSVEIRRRIFTNDRKNK